MSDTADRPALPGHKSTDPRSPHGVATVFEHEVGIRFNHKERTDVQKYLLYEGRLKVPAGESIDRKGRPLLITLKGRAEAFHH